MASPASAADWAQTLLPRAHNYLRRYIDEAFEGLRIAPRVVAEIESAATLAAAVSNGVGATAPPASAARVVASSITLTS